MREPETTATPMASESEQEGLVIYDNGLYSVEIGLPVRTPTLGMVYRVVNKKWGMIEDESPHEPSAIQLADKLKSLKEHLGTPEYQASLIPSERKH